MRVYTAALGSALRDLRAIRRADKRRQARIRRH